VLTPQESDELAHVMRGLVAQGRTVVLISHKLKEVLGVADRVAVMRRGRVVAEVRASETTVEQLANLMVGEGHRPGVDGRERVPAALSGVPPGAASPRAEVEAMRDTRPAAEGNVSTERSALALLGGVPMGAGTASPSSASQGTRHPETAAIGLPGGTATGGAAATTAGEVLLDALELQATGGNGRPALRGVDLTVRGGEIVGIAGVDGNGQRELAEVLTGLRPLTAGSGTLLGSPLAGLTPARARERGVGHVPEDRLLRAVVKALSVEENVALGRHNRPPFARGPWIDFAGRRERTRALLEAYDVRPPDPTLALQRLSGGNQQKVVVARELDAKPRLLVVVQPTRGLDIGAVAHVHAKLREARAQGAGVLLVSLDLEEVLALSDRVYVLFEGRVTGHFTRPDYDERELGRRMLGAEPGHA
jgi:simple sugar transport system ATP-binding protein